MILDARAIIVQIPDSFKDHVYIPHGDHVYVPLSVGKRRVRGEAQSWPVMKSLIDHFVPVCVLSLPGGYQEHATLRFSQLHHFTNFDCYMYYKYSSKTILKE